MTIVSPPGTGLVDVTTIDPPAGLPVGVDFPVGVFSYQVIGLPLGGGTTVTFILHGGESVNTFYKFGTRDDPTPYPFLLGDGTGADFNGSNQFTVYFKDGERGDYDEMPNGVIVDPAAPALSFTYIVSNTDDNGPGSLRAAIEFVNGLPPAREPFTEPPRIVFNIPTTDPNFIDVDASLPGGDADADVFVIHPLTALPSLTRDAIVVDGDSQRTATGDTNPFGPEIVLDGGQVVGGGSGLRIYSDYARSAA